jgi:hypothetical protein
VAERLLARLEALERAAHADSRSLAEHLSQLRQSGKPAGEALARIEAALEAYFGELGGALAAVRSRLGEAGTASLVDDKTDERLGALEGRMGAQSWEMANSIAGALTERLDQAEAGLKQLYEDVQRHWTGLRERLQALEARIGAELQRSEEAGKAHERQLGEIYEALVKLGSNQQNLSNNIATWRLENSGDVSIISNRVEQHEHAVLDMLARLSADIQSVRQRPAAAGALRAGFKRWIYGTDGVLEASWREEAKPPRQDPAPPRKGEAS